MIERAKYLGIYASPEAYPGYGHSNHGRRAHQILDDWKAESVLDVGCGFNQFALESRQRGLRATGVDFACPGADVIADATALPFAAKSFEVVTSYDMLEHCTPAQVDGVFQEFERVAKKFIFSIAFTPSVCTWQGHNLHPTVRDEEWWIRRIIRAGGTHIKKCGRFIVGKWGNPRYPSPASCVLVGNGPCLLRTAGGTCIDAHEEVVRFNNFKTAGFERHTGVRTTLWSTFADAAFQQPQPVRCVFPNGEGNFKPAASELHRIPRHLHAHVRALMLVQSTRPDSDKAALNITSGLLVAWWLLEVIGLAQISIAGFDHFGKTQSNQHHYWDPRGFKKPMELDGEAEARIFAAWARAGRVNLLNA